MYAVLGKIHYTRIEPWVLISNKDYNPSVQIGRFSGRPLYDAGSIKAQYFHDALVESLATEGQRNPICVWEREGKYYCVYGAGRVRAMRALVRSGRSDGFLKAVISGPSPTPPPTVEYEKQLNLRSGSIKELLGDDFRDLPLKARIEPEGWLYFDGCMGEFDEQANPDGKKQLVERGENSTQLER